MTQRGTLLPSPTSHTATALTNIAEPQSFKKALSSPQASQWQVEVDDEVQPLTTLSVFESLPLPPFHRAIRFKWVFKLKTGDKGEILRYKARLVVCGFMQKNGVDVDETYATVSKYASLRFMMAQCCAEKIDITHLDIKTAFLNAQFEEILWCDPPLGVPAPPGHKWRLNKALYGLKQAPRAWHIILTKTLLTLGSPPPLLIPACMSSPPPLVNVSS
jgi:hypothetical protein